MTLERRRKHLTFRAGPVALSTFVFLEKVLGSVSSVTSIFGGVWCSKINAPSRRVRLHSLRLCSWRKCWVACQAGRSDFSLKCASGQRRNCGPTHTNTALPYQGGAGCSLSVGVLGGGVGSMTSMFEGA